MNLLESAVADALLWHFARGTGVRAAARDLEVNPRTARRYYRVFRAAAGLSSGLLSFGG